MQILNHIKKCELKPCIQILEKNPFLSNIQIGLKNKIKKPLYHHALKNNFEGLVKDLASKKIDPLKKDEKGGVLIFCLKKKRIDEI